MFSVRDIQMMNKAKTDVKKETFKVILKKFSNTIRHAYASGSTNVILRVPPIVMGFPMYDIGQATWYLKRQLDNLGYQTFVPFDGTIHVSWVFRTAAPSTLRIQSGPSEDLSSLTKLRETAKKINTRSSQDGSSRRSKKRVH